METAMTVKEQLHEAIEELTDEEAGRLLDGLHQKRSSPVQNETAEERAVRVWSLAGRLAHIRTSADDFIRRKQEDIEREEERLVRRRL
jgi:hypothetical protein